MRLGIEGTDETGERVWIIPPAILDEPASAPGLQNEAIEDLQIGSFLMSLTVNGRGCHPVVVDLGDDPPDRIVRGGDNTWAVELTRLMFEDMRRDIALLRLAARAVRSELKSRPDEYAHLRGRIVVMTSDPTVDAKMLVKPAATAGISDALRGDLGTVGEDLDISRGLPTELGKRGFYGSHAGFIIQVYEGGVPDDLRIEASAQTLFRRSDVLELLRERVADKDREGNEVLLATCGLPDSFGFTCSADTHLFEALNDLATQGPLLEGEPRHLKGVAINHWRTGAFLEVWRAPGAPMPWDEYPTTR